MSSWEESLNSRLYSVAMEERVALQRKLDQVIKEKDEVILVLQEVIASQEGELKELKRRAPLRDPVLLRPLEKSFSEGGI